MDRQRARQCFMSDIFAGFLSRLCSGIKRDATHDRHATLVGKSFTAGPLARGRNLKIDHAKLIAQLCLPPLCPSPPLPLILSLRSRVSRAAEGTFNAERAHFRVYRYICKRIHYSYTRTRI